MGAQLSDDIFETMAVGMIGRFWPLIDGRPQVPVMHGAVRRDEDGYWVLDVATVAKLVMITLRLSHARPSRAHAAREGLGLLYLPDSAPQFAW
jgi:hypothetical protein